MEFQDKDILEAFSFRAFLADSHISLRARYLLFQLVRVYSLVRLGQVVSAGAQQLAKDTGFSKDGVARCLAVLVSKGLLVKAQEPTGGRPRTTYRLDNGFAESLQQPKRADLVAPLVLRILKSDEKPFSDLTISERSFLAFLWGLTDGSRTGVLDGRSITSLAKDSGSDRSDVIRMLDKLHGKRLLVSSLSTFTESGSKDKIKAYFLLGPDLIESWSCGFSWSVELSGLLGWFAGNEDALSGDSLVSLVERGAEGVSCQWSAVRGELSRYWGLTQERYYVLMQCCVALSHAFSATEGDFWGSRILYSKIQIALVIELGLLGIMKRPGNPVIEEIDSYELDSRTRALLSFAEQVSLFLVHEMRRLLPVSFQARDLGRGARLCCYPVIANGIAYMRMDLVTEDEDAGHKFGAKLLENNKRYQSELPEQLKGEVLP
ncbi:hypothetical protein ACNFIA_28895 [Pseudomonas sp. NY15437]|uniref:hypothetical protein n=1 Tax=Pseudomonas sp. NY15437 TaxID=3400360 RepID=UPI003A85CE02